MSILAGDQKPKRQKYVCSNPNCGNVFPRPKIIKYYVCPRCQTLVNITQTEDHAKTHPRLTMHKPAAQRISERAEPKKSRGQEPTQIEAKSVQPAPVDQGTLSAAVPETNKNMLMEHIKVLPQKMNELVPNPALKPPETKTASSQSVCQYGFGYLSQREKGEGIPDTCIECPKSLSCMLSEYYKTQESVKEIKKWYKF